MDDAPSSFRAGEQPADATTTTAGPELVDELTGETVTAPGGLTAGDLVDWRCSQADHPRADFRSRELRYELIGPDGAAIGEERLVADDGIVRLTSDDGADIRERRDRWITEIEERGQATTSVSTATHLALIERTGSRLDDVYRLRAMVEAKRSAAPPPRPVSARPLAVPLAIGLIVVALLAVGGAAFWLLRSDDETAGIEAGGGRENDSGERPPTESIEIPVELELQLPRGETDRIAFTGFEGQNITILMLAPQGGIGPTLDPELELYSSDGEQIGYNDDRLDFSGVGNGLNSRIDVTLPYDGEYEVVAGDLSDSTGGAYSLIIEEGGPGGDGFNGAFGGDFGEGFAVATTEAFVDGADGPGPPVEEYGCGLLEPDVVEMPAVVETAGGCEVAQYRTTVRAEDEGLAVRAAGATVDDYSVFPAIWILTDNGELVMFAEDPELLHIGVHQPLDAGEYIVAVVELAQEAPLEMSIEPLSTAPPAG